MTNSRSALEVQGKYMDALAFIYKLTSFPKIIAVNTVEMSPKADERRMGLGSPSLTIKIQRHGVYPEK